MRLKTACVCLVALVASARPLEAQQGLDVAKIFLNGSPSLTSGSGTPEGTQTASPGSLYLRTDDGSLWRKATGTGNTGWLVISLAGSGTTNTIPKWTASTTLGNSVLAEDSGQLLVAASMLPLLTDTYNIGRYDRLWNEAFIVQINAIIFALQTQTLFGGHSTIGFNAGSFAAAVGSGDTTINFGTSMTPGHFVAVRAHDAVGTITAEFFQVGSLVGGTTYNVTRNLSGLGAKNWAQGTPFLVLGTTGTGRIDLYAYDGKPRIQFVEQGATYNAQTNRAVIGNLNGYYGYATDIHGAVFGTTSGARVAIDPTNGVRIFDGTNDERVTITPAGDAIFDGKITVGTGRNVIRNSECRVSTDDWNLDFNDTGLTTNLSFGLTDFRLLNESSTCFVQVVGTPANGTSTLSRLTQVMPVIGGNRYEMSLYIGNFRVTGTNGVRVLVNFHRADNSITGSQAQGNVCSPLGGGVTTLLYLNQFCRSGVIATAPSDAVYALFYIQSNYGGSGVNPFTFYVRAYFGEAQPEQTDLTEWGAAGQTEVIGGMVKTDTITAREIAVDTLTANEIAANAITTSELSADSVTSAKIAANTIVAADIAANTITAAEIAANAITTSELDADSVTSAKIAANTITAADIAADTITANEISGTTLSAISADLGTITAGSITGGTIDGAVVRAGTGDEVVLNSSGMTLTAGTSGPNQVKWSNGVYVQGYDSSSLALSASDNINIEAGNGDVDLLGNGSGRVRLGGANPPRVVNFSGLGGNQFVCHDNDGDLYSSDTQCDGGAPAAERIAVLEREVAELRALIQSLLRGEDSGRPRHQWRER